LLREIFDFYGGRRDLKNKTIRALHPLSFIDDPTRILRAVRFEKRLSFRMEPRTLAWIREALARRMLFSVQKHRLRDELVLIFKERRPVPVLKRLWDFADMLLYAGLAYRDSWNTAYKRYGRRCAGLPLMGPIRGL
jgi:tRNA nucleotidyltransferase (CCA-adding enzyme)